MLGDGNRATPETRGAEAAAQYRGERFPLLDDTRPVGAGPQRRSRHVLELEDYLLAGWILAVEEVVRRWGGDPFALTNELTGSLGPGDGMLGWLAGLSHAARVTIFLFFFVLLTRGPEDTDRDVAIDRRTPMLALAMPVLSVYALVATGIQHALYGKPEIAPGQQPPWPGPLVPSIVRRTAAIPIGFVGDALFRSEIAHSDLASLSVTSLGSGISPGTLVMALASAFPFMILVAGPRIAAGAALAWRPWIIRFVLFYAATVVGNSNLGW